MYQPMGLLPKLLFALMLVLPGGFVIGPVVLVLKRWYDKRTEKQAQQQPVMKPVLAAELPQPAHPIEPHRAAA